MADDKDDVVARWANRTPEERAALKAAGERRYAHLRDQRRDWVADARTSPPC